MNERRDNCSIVLKAGVLTAGVTAVLFTLPALLPFTTIRTVLFETSGVWMTENPFVQLRFLGGVPGAVAAGYWAKDEFGKNEWGVGLKYAIYGAIFGLLLFYAAFVAYTVIVAAMGIGPSPTVMYLFVVSPLVLVLPLFSFYLVEAFLAGLAGVAVSRWREQRGQRA